MRHDSPPLSPSFPAAAVDPSLPAPNGGWTLRTPSRLSLTVGCLLAFAVAVSMPLATALAAGLAGTPDSHRPSVTVPVSSLPS